MTCLRSGDPVLLAPDDATLDLGTTRAVRAHRVAGPRAQVLAQRQGRSVEHVGVKQRLLPSLPAAARLVDQRAHERIEPLRRRVVGVHRNQHRVAIAEDAGVLRERPSAECHVVDRPPDRYSPAPVVTWTMPSEPASAKPRIVAVQRLRGRDVDGGQRIATGRCRVEHRRVLLGGGDHQAARRSAVARSSGMLYTRRSHVSLVCPAGAMLIQSSTSWLSVLTYATHLVILRPRAGGQRIRQAATNPMSLPLIRDFDRHLGGARITREGDVASDPHDPPARGSTAASAVVVMIDVGEPGELVFTERLAIPPNRRRRVCSLRCENASATRCGLRGRVDGSGCGVPSPQSEMYVVSWPRPYRRPRSGGPLSGPRCAPTCGAGNPHMGNPDGRCRHRRLRRRRDRQGDGRGIADDEFVAAVLHATAQPSGS